MSYLLHSYSYKQYLSHQLLIKSILDLAASFETFCLQIMPNLSHSISLLSSQLFLYLLLVSSLNLYILMNSYLIKQKIYQSFSCSSIIHQINFLNFSSIHLLILAKSPQIKI